MLIIFVAKPLGFYARMNNDFKYLISLVRESRGGGRRRGGRGKRRSRGVAAVPLSPALEIIMNVPMRKKYCEKNGIPFENEN